MNTDILTSTFMRMRSRLRTLAASIAGSDEADDILHDAFCRLWEYKSLPDSDTEAARLTYKAVRNCAIDSYRRAGAHPTVEADASIADVSYGDTCADTCEMVLAIARRHLTGRQYEILRLHDMEDVGYDEISSMLGMSPENVRVTLSRARKTIRNVYRTINTDRI